MGAGLVGGASYNFLGTSGSEFSFYKNKISKLLGASSPDPPLQIHFQFPHILAMFRNVQYPWVASHLESLPTFL